MHIYGLIIGIAIIISLNYFEKNNTVISKSKLNPFIIGLLLSMLFGARLYHVIDSWSYYSLNLGQIINIPNGGLGIYGAILGGFLYIFLFAKINKISILSITNSIAPILPLAQSIGRFGNFINGEIPIWWLESLLCFILFLIIKIKDSANQRSSALYLIGYGVIRLITEFYRNDTWIISNFKIANLISLVFVLVGIYLIKYPVRKTGSIV